MWDWEGGAPDLRAIEPVRAVRSVATSRHVPVRARCSTTGGALLLESGLEHGLVTWLDWNRDIVWISAQPFKIRWSDGVWHCPDIVTQDRDGAVTVWDARPLARQDDDFWAKAERTRAECEAVGWRY